MGNISKTRKLTRWTHTHTLHTLFHTYTTVLVAIVSVIAHPGRGNNVENRLHRGSWREHRTVVMPSFQGCGIGPAIADSVAAAYFAMGCTFTSAYLHPVCYKHRKISIEWTTKQGSWGKTRSAAFQHLALHGAYADSKTSESYERVEMYSSTYTGNPSAPRVACRQNEHEKVSRMELTMEMDKHDDGSSGGGGVSSGGGGGCDGGSSGGRDDCGGRGGYDRGGGGGAYEGRDRDDDRRGGGGGGRLGGRGRDDRGGSGKRDRGAGGYHVYEDDEDMSPQEAVPRPSARSAQKVPCPQTEGSSSVDVFLRSKSLVKCIYMDVPYKVGDYVEVLYADDKWQPGKVIKVNCTSSTKEKFQHKWKILVLVSFGFFEGLCITIQTREILNLYELCSSLQNLLTKLFRDFLHC